MTTLATIVRQVMAIDPDAPAIEFQEQWHPWGELSSVIDAVEKILDDQGIGPGTRIGGILRNTPQIAAVIIGTLINDRCIVTLNPSLPDEKLSTDITTLRTPVVIADTQDWQRSAVRDAVGQLGALGIEITGDPAQPARVILEQTGSDFLSSANGIGIEMLTSGTTGPPKRVPLKASNFSRMILDAAIYEKRASDAPPKLSSSTAILNTPFSHIGGLFSLFTTLSGGRKACMLERFRVEDFVSAVRRHRPRVAGAPPSALRMILDADVPAEALSSLVAFRTSTAPLDPALADQFYERYGIPVLQNYGATEFAGGVAGWTLPDFREFGASRRGSVGRLNPGVDGRIVDPSTGSPLPFGQGGLLELRARHLGDGESWIRTSDLARMDEEQFLWILGRADNAIIRGGFKIIPDDVVAAMESHPSILEACVVALPDARLGQVPAAGFRVKSGRSVSEDELRTYLRERLAPYQVPAKLLEVAEFSRTPSMKPSQPELRKLIEAS